MAEMFQFFSAIRSERQHQADKHAGGSQEQLDRMDDNNNGPLEFAAYIGHYAMKWFQGGFPPFRALHLLDFQRGMVKVAALAYAGWAWADRKIGLDQNQTKEWR